MNNQKQLKKYANSFISSLKSNIKSGYVISSRIHPANGKGAVLEFEINRNSKPEISFENTAPTVSKTLETIEQRLIGGNIAGVTFSGTNVYMAGNRIVIIKGDNEHGSWSNKAAEADAWRVISPRGEIK